MSALLAQAAPDPDLTRPIAVIVVCALIIIVTLVVSGVTAHRRKRTPTPDEPQSGPEPDGRVIDPSAPQ